MAENNLDLEKIFKGKKKVLLIEPPFYNLFGYQRWYYPITLTLVGTFLEERGHQVKIYDADKPKPECRSFTRTEARANYHHYEESLNDLNNKSWEEIRKILEDFSPDIVGITSVSAKIDSADNVAKITKKTLGREIPIVLGGPHAQGMLQTYPNYDFGPNYDFIVTDIPFLVDRKPKKTLLIDTDYAPRDLSTLLTSTGCPNSCTYCCNSLLNKRTIFRNLSSIKEEIYEIKKSFNGSEIVTIEDDCLFSHPKRLEEIGSFFKEYDLGFRANSRIMALSQERIHKFIENNGKRICTGVESGSQRILDKIGKRVNLDEVLRRTRWINDAELHWSAFFMVGFPFETLDDIKMTEEIAYKIQPTFISLNRFTPYPGTKIWRDFYMDSKINFRDLYQLNPKDNTTQLSDNIECFINDMFERVDSYNKSKKSIFIL